MDVRVTPTPRFISSTKCKPGTPAIYQQNRFSTFNPGPNIRQGGSKQNLQITRTGRLNNPEIASPTKRAGPGNNLLLITKKSTSKPGLLVKIAPNINTAPAMAGNKKVMLYQQIERNKELSNNAELVNRFNYKV